MRVNDYLFQRTWMLFLVIFGCMSSFTSGQEQLVQSKPVESRQVFKVDPNDTSKQLANHPLQEALQIARQTAERIDREVKDYTCDLVMRERIRGRLSNIYLAQMKLRCEDEKDPKSENPFSVYLHFLAPAKVKGREVLYVQGRNEGKMLARNGGPSNLKDVTILMKPDSKRAMRGRHYPVTEVGITNILGRLIEEAQRTMIVDRDRRECEVRVIENARIEGRSCRCVQVVLPQKRENLRFHIVRIFLDNETGFPLRYAAYSWPREKGDAPRLIEEYTFLNLKVNVGLSDADFDRENTAYRFYSSKEVASSLEANLPSVVGN